MRFFIILRRQWHLCSSVAETILTQIINCTRHEYYYWESLRRRVRWAGHERGESVGTLKETDYWRDLTVDGRIILSVLS
jgi:hypothetical protein